MMDQENGLGLLGQQLLLVLAAFQRPDDRHLCHVRHEELSGADLLAGDGSRRFLVYDSLPGTLNNKAIGIDKKMLFVELTPFDEARIRGELTLPQGTRIDRGALWRGRRKLASMMRGSPKVEQQHGMRALWTVPWSDLPSDDLQAAIACLDYLDVEGAYMEDTSLEGGVGSISVSSSSAAGGQRLEMRLGLQLQLIEVQVPILSVRGEMQTAMKLDLEFTQMLRFEKLLERNAEEAIRSLLEQDSSAEGQQRLASFILFKLARDVKKAAAEKGPEISWSRARQIVRGMMRKAA